MRSMRLVIVVVAVSLLTACGFKLRGSSSLPGFKLPFATIALSLDPVSEFHALLKRNIEASSPGTRVVNDVKDAEAILVVLADRSQKNILSLSAAGRAREYQLLRTFTFKVAAHSPVTSPAATAPKVKYTDAQPAPVAAEYIASSTITLRRDITFSDDLVLSKESEEQLLWRDMQNDLVQQLLRRLAAAKLKPVKVDED